MTEFADGRESLDWTRFQRSLGFDFGDATPGGVLKEFSEVLRDHRAVEVSKGPAGPELVRRVRDFSGAVVLVGPDTLAFGFDGGTNIPAGAAYVPQNSEGLGVSFLTSASALNPDLEPDQISFSPGKKETVPVPLRFHVTDPRGLWVGPPADERGGVIAKDADGRLQLTVVFADDVIIAADGQVPTGRPTHGEPRRVVATVESARKYLNVLVGTPFWYLTIRLADGSVVDACAPDMKVARVHHPAARGVLRPENPYPVGTTVSGDAVLTGRFLSPEAHPIVLADPLWIVGGQEPDLRPPVTHGPVGAVIDTDIATCLGLRFNGGAAVWEAISGAPRSAGWETTEYLDADEDESGVLFPVGTRVTVGRQGIDGASVARSLPSGDWAVYLDRDPMKDQVLHLAAIDCVVTPDAATLESLWGLDIDSETSYSIATVSSAPLTFGTHLPICCQVESVRQVEVELTEGIGGGHRYEVRSHIGDRDVVLHLPADLGMLPVGSVLCGVAVTCSAESTTIGELLRDLEPDRDQRGHRHPDDADRLLLSVIDSPPTTSRLAHDTCTSVPKAEQQLRDTAFGRGLEPYLGDDLRWRLRPTGYGVPKLPVDKDILDTLRDAVDIARSQEDSARMRRVAHLLESLRPYDPR